MHTIIIILFKSGNKPHKHKLESYRQTDKQYKQKISLLHFLINHLIN